MVKGLIPKCAFGLFIFKYCFYLEVFIVWVVDMKCVVVILCAGLVLLVVTSIEN